MGGRTKAIPTGDGWVTIVSNHRQPKWQQPQRRCFHHPSLYNRPMRRYRTSTRVQSSNRRYNWRKLGTRSAPLQYHLKPSYKGKFIKSISDLFPCQAQLQHTSKPHPNHPPTGPLLLPPPTTTSLIHSHPLHSKSKLNMQPCRKPINFGINALAPTPPAHLNNNLPIYASVLRNDADNRNSHSPTFTHNTHWQFFLDNNPWTEITTPTLLKTPISHQPRSVNPYLYPPIPTALTGRVAATIVSNLDMIRTTVTVLIGPVQNAGLEDTKQETALKRLLRKGSALTPFNLGATLGILSCPLVDPKWLWYFSRKPVRCNKKGTNWQEQW